MFTIGNTLRELCHIGLIPEYWHHHLLHQSTEVLQGVGVDVATGHVVEELLQLVRERQGFSLDEEDSLVPEWTGPVCVYL